MMKTFRFSKEVLSQIYSHAEKEYPGECCGWVILNKDNSMTYTASVNLQDKYHKLDPENYPRTSKDAFLMDVLKLSRAVEEARENQGRLYCIVHSHIDVGAYFSTEDKKQMTDPSGEQVYPSDCYLVTSIQDGKHTEDAVFFFDDSEKDFIAGTVQMAWSWKEPPVIMIYS